VTLVQRFGYHNQPTIVVLTFSSPLDQGRAQDVKNYKIVTLGGPGKAGSHHGHRIAIGAAKYDPTSLAVTLHPVERLNIHDRYLLQVNLTNTRGLTGPMGGPLGGDYEAVISRSTLVLPASKTVHAISARRATGARK